MQPIYEYFKQILISGSVWNGNVHLSNSFLFTQKYYPTRHRHFKSEALCLETFLITEIFVSTIILQEELKKIFRASVNLAVAVSSE